MLDAAERERGAVEELVERRLRGEPLPWIVGRTVFCGLPVAVDPGVFVPRPHSEALALRAAELLPATGIAIDLCTGSGAVAVVLASSRPRSTVVATDIDPKAVACARRNGVDARLGDLDDPVPPSLRGRVDVITAVVPYVPTAQLQFLPRDVLAHEPRASLEGGERGTDVLRRVAETAGGWLRPGGSVLLEVGGDEAHEMTEVLASSGFDPVRVHADEEGQDRSIEARWPRAHD